MVFGLADFVHLFGQYCVESGLAIPHESLVVCVGKILLTFSNIYYSEVWKIQLETMLASMLENFGHVFGGQLLKAEFSFFEFAIFVCYFLSCSLFDAIYC